MVESYRFTRIATESVNQIDRPTLQRQISRRLLIAAVRVVIHEWLCPARPRFVLDGSDSGAARAVMRSLSLPPAEKNPRSIRSRETSFEEASILATRDWLEPIRSANSCCVSWLLSLSRRTPRPTMSRNSIICRSSSVKPRNSAASPIFQPAASKASRFLASTAILSTIRLFCHPVKSLQTTLAVEDNMLRRLLSGLGKHRDNHDGIRIEAIDDAPALTLVSNSQLMASRTDVRHRS